MSELKWTPDGTALALVWEKGGFSLWSVFGALLLHSMGVESGYVHHSDECVCLVGVTVPINRMLLLLCQKWDSWK